MRSSLTITVRAELRDEQPDYNVYCGICGGECWGAFKRLYVQVSGDTEWTPGSLTVCKSCAD